MLLNLLINALFVKQQAMSSSYVLCSRSRISLLHKSKGKLMMSSINSVDILRLLWFNYVIVIHSSILFHWLYRHPCMLCLFTYFSYTVLFDELRSIDSVVKGTDKLMKGFLQWISNGKLDCTSEDVRGTAGVCVLINNVILLSTSNLRNHWNEWRVQSM